MDWLERVYGASVGLAASVLEVELVLVDVLVDVLLVVLVGEDDVGEDGEVCVASNEEMSAFTSWLDDVCIDEAVSELVDVNVKVDCAVDEDARDKDGDAVLDVVVAAACCPPAPSLPPGFLLSTTPSTTAAATTTNAAATTAVQKQRLRWYHRGPRCSEK